MGRSGRVAVQAPKLLLLNRAPVSNAIIDKNIKIPVAANIFLQEHCEDVHD